MFFDIASRPSASRARPLILLAGAILQRVCTLREKCENRRKIDPRALPERDARKHSRSNRFLSADGLRKGHPSVPETSSRRPRGALGSLRAAPGTSRQRLGTYPRRFGDAPKARGCPGRVSGSILDRFKVPRGGSRERLRIDLGIDFQDASRAIRMRFAKQKDERLSLKCLQLASWPPSASRVPTKCSPSVLQAYSKCSPSELQVYFK